jgi:hypothetical protein
VPKEETAGFLISLAGCVDQGEEKKMKMESHRQPEKQWSDFSLHPVSLTEYVHPISMS